MLHRYVIAEILKLRRSLALMLCLAAPSCVVILNFLMALERDGPAEMAMFSLGGSALWAFAMLPLTVTALSVLMAQMEHGPRTWDHLLTLPRARPHLFLAKALVMMGLVAAMTIFLLAGIVATAAVLPSLHPVNGGELDVKALALTLARMTAAAGLVCMLQLWVALRFRSFVPPLVFGIAGTFVAVAATSAKQGLYFPWLMAVNVLAAEPERQQLAIEMGGLGGLAVLLFMLVHLNFREA